ncbi:MAG: hypothetical protein ABGX07_02440 [Pirellulaceae bacterium]
MDCRSWQRNGILPAFYAKEFMGVAFRLSQLFAGEQADVDNL